MIILVRAAYDKTSRPQAHVLGYDSIASPTSCGKVRWPNRAVNSVPRGSLFYYYFKSPPALSGILEISPAVGIIIPVGHLFSCLMSPLPGSQLSQSTFWCMCVCVCACVYVCVLVA